MGNENTILRLALCLSLGIHTLLFRVGRLSFHQQAPPAVEIDITDLGSSSMPGVVEKAPAPARPRTPVAKAKAAPPPDPSSVPSPTASPPTAAPAEEPPPPTAGNGTGELTVGMGDGHSTSLTRIPTLLNLGDLSAILQRFYPEAARAAGREGTVVMDLHIDTDGRVVSINIVKSGGEDFDAAARRVAGLFRFTPALVGIQRVGVKMRQAIRFKLET